MKLKNYILTLLGIVILISFALTNQTLKNENVDYEIVGHKTDTVNESLTAHKFSLFITKNHIDTKIKIARQLESTKGRISNDILFFDNKESAIAYSKTWEI